MLPPSAATLCKMARILMGFASVRPRKASRSSSDLMCEVSVGGLLASAAGGFSNATINSLTFLPSGILVEILMCRSFNEGSNFFFFFFFFFFYSHNEGSKMTTIFFAPGRFHCQVLVLVVASTTR